MPVDPEKLKALKAGGSAKVGGQRVKGAAPKVQTADQKKTSEVLQAVQRLGSKPIPKVSEVWMFLADNNIQIFNNPKVIAAVQCNTWAIQGRSVVKPMGPEIMTEALNHMGAENLGALQSLLGAMGGAGGMPPMGGMPGMGMPGMGGMPDFSQMGMGGEDIPNFDDVQEEAPDLVE